MDWARLTEPTVGWIWDVLSGPCINIGLISGLIVEWPGP